MDISLWTQERHRYILQTDENPSLDTLLTINHILPYSRGQDSTSKQTSSHYRSHGTLWDIRSWTYIETYIRTSMSTFLWGASIPGLLLALVPWPRSAIDASEGEPVAGEKRPQEGPFTTGLVHQTGSCNCHDDIKRHGRMSAKCPRYTWIAENWNGVSLD